MTIAPLFLLYGYTFGRNIARTKRESLACATLRGWVQRRVVLHPDPYASREGGVMLACARRNSVSPPATRTSRLCWSVISR